MNGHPRDQPKVSLHDRWPLVRGTGGRMGGIKRNTPCTATSPPAIFMLNTMPCIVKIVYAIVTERKINASYSS